MTILWYLHDHGRGHLERARAVIPHLTAPVVVAAGPGLAEAAADALDVGVVGLPSDVPERRVPTVGPWHHAPAGETLRRRTTALVDVVERYDCSTAVVDVSVEVTVLARLLGLRTVTVRQSGHRTDPAHRIGFATADVVWVPQHRSLEPIDVPVDERWFFSGPFSRLDVERGTWRGQPASGAVRHAVLLVGAGGTSFDLDVWRDTPAPPGWRVTIAGIGQPWRDGWVESVGRVDPVRPLLCPADVVITSGGWAAIADCVAAQRPMMIVPEDRPFDEQHVRAGALAAAGLAGCVERWPSPGQLADVLVEAANLDPTRWCAFHDGHGAQRSAAMIDRVHDGC